MPLWSPDGTRLFFSHFGESDWLFAGVDAAGGNFRTVNKESERKVGGAGPILKGEEWLCHDLESFFVLTVAREKSGTARERPKSEAVTGLSMPPWVAVSPMVRQLCLTWEWMQKLMPRMATFPTPFSKSSWQQAK